MVRGAKKSCRVTSRGATWRFRGLIAISVAAWLFWIVSIISSGAFSLVVATTSAAQTSAVPMYVGEMPKHHLTFTIGSGVLLAQLHPATLRGTPGVAPVPISEEELRAWNERSWCSGYLYVRYGSRRWTFCTPHRWERLVLFGGFGSELCPAPRLRPIIWPYGGQAWPRTGPWPRYVWFPMWPMPIGLAVLTLHIARRRARKRAWEREGCCRRCGYEVKLLEVCPECGTGAGSVSR